MQHETLRFAFVTPEYVTEKYFDGGLANYLHRVTVALAGMGHDIHVLTLSEIDQTEFELEGVTVHRIAGSKWLARRNRSAGYGLPTIVPFLEFSFRVYRQLRKLNSQQPFHLVQFPSYSCCGLVSMCFLGVPHVLRASSYQPALNDAAGVRGKLNSRIEEQLEGLQFRLSRHIYAPSQTLQTVLAQEAGLSRARVIRSPFFVETLDWDSSIYDRFLENKKYLLFFGRFQLHKGFHTLAQALPRFLEKYPDAYAVVVGRDMESRFGPSLAEYARAQCGNFAERLVVLEKLPHRQLYPVIAAAQLVVLPSLVENLPNAGLEAMGLGKVVIGTEGTGFNELIDEGVNGFLVSPNNPPALAEKLIATWVDPRLHEIGLAAREKMLEFSPERTVQALVSYYREILDGLATT